ADRLAHPSAATRILADRLAHPRAATRILADRLAPPRAATRILADRIAAPRAAPRILADRIVAPRAAPRILADRIAAPSAAPRLLTDRIAAPRAATHILADRIGAPSAATRLLADRIAAPRAATRILADGIAAPRAASRILAHRIAERGRRAAAQGIGDGVDGEALLVGQHRWRRDGKVVAGRDRADRQLALGHRDEALPGKLAHGEPCIGQLALERRDRDRRATRQHLDHREALGRSGRGRARRVDVDGEPRNALALEPDARRVALLALLDQTLRAQLGEL